MYKPKLILYSDEYPRMNYLLGDTVIFGYTGINTITMAKDEGVIKKSSRMDTIKREITDEYKRYCYEHENGIAFVSHDYINSERLVKIDLEGTLKEDFTLNDEWAYYYWYDNSLKKFFRFNVMVYHYNTNGEFIPLTPKGPYINGKVVKMDNFLGVTGGLAYYTEDIRIMVYTSEGPKNTSGVAHLGNRYQLKSGNLMVMRENKPQCYIYNTKGEKIIDDGSKCSFMENGYYYTARKGKIKIYNHEGDLLTIVDDLSSNSRVIVANMDISVGGWG